MPLDGNSGEIKYVAGREQQGTTVQFQADIAEKLRDVVSRMPAIPSAQPDSNDDMGYGAPLLHVSVKGTYIALTCCDLGLSYNN